MRSALFAAGVSVAMAIGLLAACGSDDQPRPSSLLDAGGGGGDAGHPTTGDASDHDAANDDGGMTCPDLAPGAGVVNATYFADSPPDELGGELVPGTYDLTQLEIYLGTPEQGDPDAGPMEEVMDSAQASFVLTPNTILLAKKATVLGVTGALTVSFASVRTEMAELVTDESCPGTLSQKTPFTASGKTLSMHTAQTRREIYTRR